MKARFDLPLLIVFCSGLLYGQSYTAVTVAGTDTIRDGAQAATVPLRRPVATTLDAQGNLFIADAQSQRIRKVTPQGVISTVAGTGFSGYTGDGSRADLAALDAPYTVATDKAGNLYIGDYNNNVIRKVTASTGIITTIAGNGSARASGDNGPALNAGFDPYHIAVDGQGNVYIADWLNDRVRKISASTGVISTIAGLGISGFSGDNGQATAAALDGPAALAVDATGIIYVCDQYNNVIRKIALDGTISTIAGTGGFGDDGDGGPANFATFVLPDTIALDPAGTKLYVVNLNRVRVIDLASNTISKYAGSGDIGFGGDGQAALTAKFFGPQGLAVAANGDAYIADSGNHRVRRVKAGVVDTVAGTDVRDGSAATSAYLSGPEGVLVTPNGDVVISEGFGARVRKVAAVDGRIATIAGTGNAGYSNGRISEATGLTLDPAGNILFADRRANRIQRLNPAGGMTTQIGSSSGKAGYAGDGTSAANALLREPTSVAYDAAGNLYICDAGNYRVRKVDAASGMISTVAGMGKPGITGVGGPATQAPMEPTSIAVDAAGNIYIADLSNRVLKVAASSGLLSIVAGTGKFGYSGDGNAAASATLALPSGVALDAAGNLYIADFGNFVVRKVTPAGMISTIAGNGYMAADGETGSALLMGMSPFALTVASSGEIYIADPLNDRIRKLVPMVARALVISSGNNQTGNSGAKLKVAVKITDAAGNGVAAMAVTFSVTSGSATVPAGAVFTDAYGVAGTIVTVGDKAGPVVVTATASGLPAVTFALTVKETVIVPVPQITPGGVVGAGLAPNKRTLAVGGIATVFGMNLAQSGTARKVEAGDLVGGKVPTALAGVCVLVGQIRAPVFAVYPTQVNFQVPAVPAGDAVPVRVITGCGSAAEVQTNAETVSVQANAPEFFFFRAGAGGVNPVAAINAVTGAYAGSPDLGAGFTPARPKDVLTIFGTSFGAIDPGVAPGDIPPVPAAVTGTVKVQLNGRELPAENVLYAGVTPANPGLYQLNIVIPDDAPDGDLNIVLTIGASSTPQGAYLTVRSGQ